MFFNYALLCALNRQIWTDKKGKKCGESIDEVIARFSEVTDQIIMY